MKKIISFPWRSKKAQTDVQQSAGVDDGTGQSRPMEGRIGSQVLKDVCQGPEDGVDLVFVHGLRGDRLSTWSVDDVCWPRDFLAEDLQCQGIRSRIITWGYDAMIAKLLQYTSQESLWGNANSLLGDLEILRKEAKDRPMIFIGHSLGGLVIKAALNRSCQYKSRYPRLAAIYEKTSGVIFMGTPHSGSEQATYGDILASLAALSLHRPNKGLLKILNPNSGELDNMQEQFTTISNDMPIACFREEIATGAGLIVPERSAFYEGFKVRKSSIHANHMDMVKFATRIDPGYMRVKAQIENIIEDSQLARDTAISARQDGNEHWLIHRSTNPHFTGRRNIIDKIVKAIISEPNSDHQTRFILTGMGGQGKSEICLHVANKLRDSFWGVFWIDVGNQATAKSHFCQVADMLVCDRSIDVVRTTLSSLPRTKRWLLILDNADNPDTDYLQYFPTGTRGAIILTSRNVQCGSLAVESNNHLELDHLEVDEAVELLRKAAKSASMSAPIKDDEMSLVLALGSHALAIVQAGAYIANTRSSVGNYIQFLRTNRDRMLHKSSLGHIDPRYKTVYATFEASMEFLKSSDPDISGKACGDCLDILRILSSFHYENIPLVDILSDTREGTQNALKTKEEHEMLSGNMTAWHVAQVPDIFRAEKHDFDFRIIEAISRLESLALVRMGSSERPDIFGSVSMHPLVHGWTRDRHKNEEKETMRMAECVVALAEFAFGNWRPYHYQFRTHLKQLVDSDPDLVDEAAQSRGILQICVGIAWICHHADLDEDMYELTCQVLQRLGRGEHDVTEDLREFYRVFALAADASSSQTAQAIRVFKAIADLDDKTCAQNDKIRVINLCDLGEAYNRNGQTKEAVMLLRRVVTVSSELGEENKNLLLLRAQYELAMALMNTAEAEEAIELLERVVGVEERTLSRNERLACQRLLARAYHMKGDFQEAISRLEDLVPLSQQTFSEEAPQTMRAQFQLGTSYRDAGRIIDAIDLYERVVNVWKRTLNKKHPELLSSQIFLAHAHLMEDSAQGTLVAISIMEEVVEIRKSMLQDNNHDLFASQHVLSEAYLRVGRVSEAVKILEDVVEGQSQLYDEDHRERVKSEELLKQARTMYEQSS